ncbi:helix-turn-helix domain containing protein [Paenibacillus polymyxa]|nr:helix-turn-helix domain containing protein [Paenibacillus polymyxa]
MAREEYNKLKNKRRSIYLACEEMDFTWDQNQVQKFDEMWTSGISLLQIGKELGRDPDEVMMLAVDRIKKRCIGKRPGGALGAMA